ncbi:MAG TPA: NAD(P)-dependent oxidoreductase [Candidatus Methylomirabilis sp.]|nr:NAD(P)-dependent oxidoreductase [Candidatus Methylomirabilis sp.]
MTRVEAFEQRHWSKQKRIEAGKRPPGERARDFREIYLDYAAEEVVMLEAQRCLECKEPSCESACPLGNRIRDWLRLASEGKFLEAAAVSRETSNLPEICGRVCPQDRLCEEGCILVQKREPVSIGAIERFINEYTFRVEGPPRPTLPPSSGCRVAIVGSGPAGLACADELTKMGHQVTVFEAWPAPGGLLVYGIPGFKLEKHVVERRIDYLEALSVRFVCNTRIGVDRTIDDLFREGYRAVFLGTGSQKAKSPHIEGDQLAGVLEALPFLIRNNTEPRLLPEGFPAQDDLTSKRVVVLGGGDTAMDCLRTAVRLGASKVTCVYRRDEENMPGSRREVKSAKEEGVEFHWLTAPVKFLGDEQGKLRAIECVQMALGEPDKDGRRKPIEVKGSNYLIEADLVIMAFGFDASPVQGEDASKLNTNKWGNYEVDRIKMTSWPGVFAGGDIVRGADLVVTAIKDGRDAARGIDEYLRLSKRTEDMGADLLSAERGQA